ncbi:MAG: alcohol dehydrogenase catalytic domain-containing protein [Candidatus Eisenbacteria bacterium]|uniref:Alcohol dehydrogenase catalytic domain-containing protein n=1 Tax=Eiseniibacteriota bacterium TaxID=2212470 RepID=A0A9D6LAX8_UNCEI|nr:alcohol dehydrogenase catalytic domain-containing protein [Candidatus Eisenbacteria bacterium]MBI3539838.1 alcohol dehydrogenase catalytic domain-containing protein [Candidatus Eisenbacteria bacterium]
MKAITFAAPIPTYLVTLAAGRLSPRLLVGPHACTRHGEVADPELPGDRWVRVGTRLGGICGSDLAIVALAASPATSPFSSFPFVIGHENVGVIEAIGAAVTTLRPGQRVVVNPLLACAARAIDPPCAACRAGAPSRCEHFTDGALAPGMLIGTTRGLGGSWGERFVAHETQVHVVPDTVSDEGAVLAEPFACCVHAVRAALPAAGERVLVIGAGSIGLLTVAALHALAPGAAITVVARHGFQGEHATRLGAARVLTGRPDARALAEAAGARLLATVIGPPAAVGGFDRAFVCVTGARAMDDALRFTRAGGTITLLGNARHLDGLDWTPLWMKELVLRGSVTYGAHPGAGGDAFAEALALIASGRAPVAPLVTHTFPLAEHARALAAAMGKADAKSVKVAFRF